MNSSLGLGMLAVFVDSSLEVVLRLVVLLESLLVLGEVLLELAFLPVVLVAVLLVMIAFLLALLELVEFREVLPRF